MVSAQDIARSSVASELAKDFQNPEIHDLWESVYRDNPLQRRFNDHMMERFLERLRLPKDARVLDAGCGVGDHTFRFAAAGFSCVGVDISEPVLAEAREHAKSHGLDDRTTFIRAGLESLQELPFEFDAIHCRGVLMHIPNWQSALSELCRILRPGGRILILENNNQSVECLGVRLIRLFRKSESRLEFDKSGWIFHNDDPSQAPVTRIANVRFLTKTLEQCGVEVEQRFATEFWDLNRFPKGFFRNRVVDFNRAYFNMRMPATLSLGNAIIGIKQGSAD